MDVGLLDLPDAPQGHGKIPRGARGRGPALRRQREFLPEEKKDTVYWEKRRKNNEAARRSREKRRLNDAALEGRLAALLAENAQLRAELQALKHHFGLLPAAGGAGTLPLQALLWMNPWTGDPRAGPEPLPPLPGSHGCVWRPCALDAGVPGFQSCLVAHRWKWPGHFPQVLPGPCTPQPQENGYGLAGGTPNHLLHLSPPGWAWGAQT
ncbi:hypothetical protein mRhiFer1_008620 [Rhinolophus ferrumequinum]|uniref:BZIP domain-containing protein n=1 Tax=Rhinolophus ferrumequinum TaxID=59479 RepID=A0A7J7U124_RHIFE|nr:hypothetical protein mRhiFer1_008620 [Rhinolophus ferrumequinum]